MATAYYDIESQTAGTNITTIGWTQTGGSSSFTGTMGTERKLFVTDTTIVDLGAS